MRQMIFISHANPEDNEFAQWLALRLAREGYAVWCDLTKLLGGEDFWRDAEEAIRERTIRFLYVLSRTSNVKEGPLQELAVAKSVRKKDATLKDSVIPLRIDDLSYDDFHIEIRRLIAVDFASGWASGLQGLLKRLSESQVPKDPRFSPESVASWWNTEFDPGDVVHREEQKYVSNWFPLRSLPREIRVHEIPGIRDPEQDESLDVNYPAHQFKGYIVTFAAPNDLTGRPRTSLTAGRSVRMLTQDFLAASDRQIHLSRGEARTAVRRLLRLAWGKLVNDRKLLTYDFSGNVRALYVPEGFAEGNKASFLGMDGKKHHRSLVGYKTMSGTLTKPKHKRYWHFGVHAEPCVYPVAGFAIKPHVLFSEDGRGITGSAAQQHRARRSQCKLWWNDAWRDRLMAMMAWLRQGAEIIELPVSPSVSLEVDTSPVEFISPVSYDDKDAGEPLEDIEDEMDDETDINEPDTEDAPGCAS